MIGKQCPKCGAELVFRAEKHLLEDVFELQWKCGSVKWADEDCIREDEQCLRNQLAQRDEKIERLQAIVDKLRDEPALTKVAGLAFQTYQRAYRRDENPGNLLWPRTEFSSICAYIVHKIREAAEAKLKEGV